MTFWASFYPRFGVIKRIVPRNYAPVGASDGFLEAGNIGTAALSFLLRFAYVQLESENLGNERHRT